MSLLTGLGGSFDDAFGINSSSQIVGTSELSSGGKRAVIYGSVSTQDLSSLAGIPSNALAINDNGQIVGDTFAFDGVGSFTSSGFSILNGAIQFLPSLGGDATGANDVNNKGDIVGYSRLTNGGRTHAFLYRNGVMQDLGTLTATESAAYAINESGAVVGDWGDTIDTLRGFIYQNGTMTDLNTLIDPASGWLIKGGTDINESGQILVDAVHPVIGRHALLLSPTADTDNDGVPDDSDNCILHANPDQRDTNGDNYGNRCDADLNQSNTVNAADLATFKSRFGTTNADADLDGNGNVNAADLAIFKALFGKAPGPSGLVP
jgi:probable HAF family extracellular repeat protein